MRVQTLRIIGSAATLTLFAVAPVLALESDGGVDVQVAPGPRQEPRVILQRIIQQGQEHRNGNNQNNPEDRPMPPAVSFGGTVSSVSSPNFSLEIPAVRERATTTITVVTSASTTFLFGREGGSFDNVSIGSFVVAAGAYATSTQTLTARRVDIASSTVPRGLEVRAAVHDRIETRLGEGFFSRLFASSTAPAPLRFFFGAQASSTLDEGERQGFVRSLFQGVARFFGR